jgi:phosphoribosylformylglycinamidine synthase subunit PurS
MRARVIVTLRAGVLDPAGQAVASSLKQLGFEEVREARLGKVIDLDLGDVSPEEAKKRVDAMGRQLLANLVIEDFTVEIR